MPSDTKLLNLIIPIVTQLFIKSQWKRESQFLCAMNVIVAGSS